MDSKTTTEHREFAILIASHLADQLESRYGSNIANYVFDKLADSLIAESSDTLYLLMQEISDRLMREYDSEVSNG